MRKRDLAILLLSAFAIFFALQNEGNFSFRESWFHFVDDSYPFKHEVQRLPPPLVTDLNGDGRKEVLIATYDAEIQLIEPHHSSIDDDFSEARVLAKLSLLPERVRVAAGRLPVAMAAGNIHRTFRDGEQNKQVLVVVTAGWSIICYDHNLKKLWEVDVEEDFPTLARHKEVSILITNYTLKHGDVGLVIVGGSVEAQPHIFLDPFEEELLAERAAERHRHSADEKEKTEDVSAGQGSATKARHMHYYAFAGRTGIQRWNHKSEDYQRDSNEAELIPQHNYKLDIHSMNRHPKTEMECRQFRESILGVMPHRWERRDDTKFELAHFRKHKRRHHKQLPMKQLSSIHKPDEPHLPGKDSGNKLANVLSRAADMASATKNRKRSQYVPTITNTTNFWWVPNVLVAHLKEGIEAIHIATGRTVCKLFLHEDGLHADVNGDGVLDHVQAIGGMSDHFVPTGLLEVIKPCTAVVTSGTPVREQLFNVSICRHYFFGGFQHGESASIRNSAPVDVVTPVLLPTNDGHNHRKWSHGDIIFLTSRGEMTSYTPSLHGKDAILRWQIITETTWTNSPVQAGISVDKVIPTLKIMSLTAHGPPGVILAAGERAAVIVSPSGSQLATLILPSPPTHAIVVADFSGDGLNDLIVVTSLGVYGFVQTQQPGALLFSSLVGCLIVVMCVIFVIQHFSLPDGKKRTQDR